MFFFYRSLETPDNTLTGSQDYMSLELMSKNDSSSSLIESGSVIEDDDPGDDMLEDALQEALQRNRVLLSHIENADKLSKTPSGGLQKYRKK